MKDPSRMRKETRAWLGGVFSAQGELIFNTKSNASARIVMTFGSYKKFSLIKDLGKKLDLPVVRLRGDRKRLGVRISSTYLAALWPYVEPYLTEDRIREHEDLVRRRDEHNNNLAMARQYAKEAAMAARARTWEQRRKAREAAYDSSDPAVLVVGEEQVRVTALAARDYFRNEHD